MTEALGERVIRAAAAREFARAGSLLAPQVEFRALTPHKLVEADGRDATMAVLEEWFSPVEAIEELTTDTVVDRPGVHYRIRWSTAEDGCFVFEQQAYYDVAEDGIVRMHIVCSGDRPVGDDSR